MRTEPGEDPLVRANRLLEESQAIAHLGGWEYDVAENRISWTPETFRIYGVGPDYDPNNLANDIGFYSTSSAPIIAEAFAKALAMGDGYDLELELVRADGKTIWVRTVGRAFLVGGKIVRVAGNIMDIDERKIAQLRLAELNAGLERCVLERTAELESANRDLESFAHTMTHDLKAPLRAIAGFSRMVVEDYKDVLDTEGKRLLGIVYENAVKLDALISDLSCLSRIGRQVPVKSSIAMRAMAKDVYHDLAVPDKDAMVVLSIDDLPDVIGDPGLLREVWGNLLSNALKFTSDRSFRKIDVYAHTTDAERIYFIRDNGVGFNPKYAGKLFGLFQRLHREGQYAGTGAGLAKVKRIVELHGGRVGAESVEGEGAVFYFALPLESMTAGGKRGG